MSSNHFGFCVHVRLLFCFLVCLFFFFVGCGGRERLIFAAEGADHQILQ